MTRNVKVLPRLNTFLAKNSQLNQAIVQMMNSASVLK